jgi:hypothetical protein
MEQLMGWKPKANLKGPRGPAGERGAPGLPGSNAIENDAAVAAYIGTEGTSATKTAVQAVVDAGVTRNLPGVSVAPVFIDTRPTGVLSKVPDNVRTGLAATQYAAGGYTTEMAIAVVGARGSKVLTTTETAKVAGLGAGKFPAVINSTDGQQDTFVTVMGHNGSTEIRLRQALTADFTGTLSAKFDSLSGQHLTQRGTRAYIAAAARASAFDSARGRILAGTWSLRPADFNTAWVRNAALVAYGLVNSEAPVVRTDLTTQSAHNPVDVVDGVDLHPLATASGVQVGTHLNGHGMTADLYTGRRDTVLEFWTAAQRSGQSGAAYRLRVTVVADGISLYDAEHDAYMKQVKLATSGYDRITVSITNANPEDTKYYIYASEMTLREAGAGGKIGKGKVVTFGDSWWAFYDGYAAKVLREKTGAVVVNRAVGGMTSDWGMAMFDEYVLKERPDECWIHFFINDANNSTTATFVAPDGTTQRVWPSGLTLDQARDRWRQNMLRLIERCQRAGIRPVIFLPTGTASEAQTSRSLSWFSVLDRAGLSEWQATVAELAAAGAYVNTVGKYPGARVQIGASPRYATGAAPADAWTT